MRISPRLARNILILALVLGFGLRLFMVFSKSNYRHDESITYLVATGHQGEWQDVYLGETPPLGEWVNARTFQRYVQPEDAFVFGRIAAEMALHDVHPPLYFWMMHLWTLVFGTGLYSGPLLNVLMDVITALVLLRFAFAVLRSWPQAQLVTALWALSPTAIFVGLEARQYNLLALVTLLAAFAVLCFVQTMTGKTKADKTKAGQLEPTVNRQIRWQFPLLTGLMAAGLLTHYEFAPILGIAVGALALRLGKHHWRTTAGLLVAAILAALLVLLLDPGYLSPFSRVVGRTGIEGLPTRIFRTALATLQLGIDETFLLVIPALILEALGLLVLIGGALLLIRQVFAGRAIDSPIPDERGSRHGLPLVAIFLLGTAASVMGTYVLDLVPLHAMGPRYMAPVAVFTAFAPVLLANLPGLARRRDRLFVGAIALIVVSSIGSTANLIWTAQHNAQESGHAVLTTADANQIVIDSAARGALFPVIMRLEPDTLVFIANQEDLLANPDPWLAALEAAPVLFVNASLQYGNSPEQLEQLLTLMESTGIALGAPLPFWDNPAILTQPPPAS